MKTFKDFVTMNEDNTRQITKAAEEIMTFLFTNGDKSNGLEKYINSVVKDRKLSRSELKKVITRVKNVHGYSGVELDKLLTEATLNEASLKTGDNVSIKTKNFNAYGKIIGMTKNGTVEVKFFNDKTSKEEIAFFDLKQLTKV